MGRSRRPVHQHREDHHGQAPGQARRAASDPDRPGERLPDRRARVSARRGGRSRSWLRLPRRTARLRLTVLYGGAVFVACGATILAVTYLVYGMVGQTMDPVL